MSDERESPELQREMARGRELMKIIDLGLEVQQFKAGNLHARLLEDSERERHELIALVIALDPDDFEQRKTIQIHRQRIKVLEHWQDVFDGYIQAMEVAESEFHDRGEVPPD